MNPVRLTGQLVCKTADEAKIVARHLPQHVELTRAEPGCLFFDVAPTADPMIWTVEERFASVQVFELHQKRAADSEWGRATANIERRYSIEGLSR
ncbi:putative quinol monooxygenase [Leifsonia sp. 2MCAF36]|uniref:putative quinol monooxygenase n=1 Tax=Leifsonia sp. 2MCAF36 TaxID=3232988 RepID=UPI003F9E8C0B